MNHWIIYATESSWFCSWLVNSMLRNQDNAEDVPITVIIIIIFIIFDRFCLFVLQVSSKC